MSIAGVIATALRQDAPYQAEIAMGAQLIMDFQGARSGRRPYYWYRGTRYTSPEKIPGWSFSRNSEAYAEDSAGNLIRFPANVPRVTDRGLLLEEARTNYVPNSSMAGAVVGSPGTWPGNWGTAGVNPGGMAWAVTGLGNEHGLPYVEMRLSGTPLASGTWGFNFHPPSSSPTTEGVTWTNSVFLKVLNSIGVSGLALGCQETTGGPNVYTTLSAVGPASLSKITRLTQTRVTTAGSTGINGYFLVNFTAGQPVDITLRVYAPQLEQGANASSPTITTGGAATRSADNPAILGQSIILGQFRTNKVAIFNANPVDTSGLVKTGDPAAVLSVVDDAAAIADAGLSQLVTGGKVFKLDNSAGSAQSFVKVDGPAGSTATHTASFYVRGGTGLVCTVTIACTAFGASAAYVRRSITAAGSVAQGEAQIAANAGQVIYFTLPQLEQAAAASEVIVTQGAPVAVGKPATVVVRAEMSASANFTQDLAVLSDGTTANRVSLRRDPSAQAVLFPITGGVNQPAIGVGGKGGARSLGLAARHRIGSQALSVDGAAVQSGAVLNVPGLTRLDLGQISGGGGNYLNGYLQRVMILGDVDDAQLQRLAA